MVACARHRRDHQLIDVLRLHLQLVLHVHGRGGQEGVDAAARRRLDRFGAAVDILLAGTRQAAHHRILGALGDLVDRLEIAVRRDRETGLDDVDTHGVEQRRDVQLFLERHGGAGALLAVAQGGVEDDDAVFVGAILVGLSRIGGHWAGFLGLWRSGRFRGLSVSIP